MAQKTGTLFLTSAAYHKVSTARLRLVCDSPRACLRYYLGHTLCVTAGMTAAYVNKTLPGSYGYMETRL